MYLQRLTSALESFDVWRCQRLPSASHTHAPAAVLCCGEYALTLHRTDDASSLSQGCVTPQRKLHVGYMLPHHNLTGGMKCLVEHIRLLRARGHTTVALHRRASEPMLRRHITCLNLQEPVVQSPLLDAS